MSSVIGKKFTVSIFGDARGEGVGVTIEGLPMGLPIQENDLIARIGKFKILSGTYAGKTTGTPLTAIFPPRPLPETETEISPNVLRPGFPDIGEYKKAGGQTAQRAGGHYAEQGVTPLLFAGILAEQLLKTKKIRIASHIFSIGEVQDESFEDLVEPERKIELIKGELPTLDRRKEMLMKLKIAQTENNGDTVGGQIETMVLGLSAGIGEPIFGSMNSKLATTLFALPRVAAVEFGAGCNSGLMNGSVYNDSPFVDTLKGQISTRTNHCGGIQGGITNGMPLVLRVTFTPSPAIAKKQATVQRSEQRDIVLPPFVSPVTCDLPEMCKLVQAAVAITIVDELS